MRKVAVVLSVLLILMGVFAGCNSKASSEDILLSVLNSETDFIDENGNSVKLKDYKLDGTELTAVPEKYAFVDFDGDGANELAVHVTPDYGAYIVLHLYGGRVYGFEFNEREMIDLKQDGTFVQSSGAGFNGIAEIKFNGDKYVLTETAFADDYEGVYRLEGKPSDSKETQKVFDSQYKKSSVKWTEM
ncbi:MAG: hypothetical protein ACI4F7_07300 [Acutalibacteraceae bacterium]